MRPRDRAQLRGSAQAGKGRKLAHVNFIGPAGFGIGDVGEPFELGRNVGEVAELGRRQRAPFNRNQVLGHHPPPCAPVFLGTLPRRIPNTIMYFIVLVRDGLRPP